jgi:RNA polymerase sigma factor (sigma-70 family)
MTRARRKLGQNGPLDRERAFELLFCKKTFASVWHWLERLGVPLRDRRDVAQEVFLAAHQSFHTYDPMRSRPERWLNKITVHVSAHYRDRAQHRREELTPEDFFDGVDDQPGPDELIGCEQDRLEVLDMLQMLDVDLRSVLIAHDIDGIPMAEIAEQHGIPLSTAYKWRARALQAFQAALEERRREERERTGGIALIPLDIGALLAAVREIPDAPEDVRLEVMQGVREAFQNLGIDAGGDTSGGWSSGKGSGSQLGSPGGGMSAPLVGAPLAALAAAVALWLSADAPRPRVAEALPASVAAAAVEARIAAPDPGALATGRAAGASASAAPPRAASQPPTPAAARRPAPNRPPASPALLDVGEREVTLIDGCRRALGERDAQDALACLAQYEREVPAPRLDREKRMLRVRALRRAGALEEARREARLLVDLYPGAEQIRDIRDLL